MKKVLLITGPAGDAQGWGDLAVTQSVCQAIKDSGYDSDIAFVSTMDQFYSAIGKDDFDMVWSCLYHISDRSETIGMAKGEWLADIFDEKSIPYIGPDAACMKTLINKTTTHDMLEKKNLAVPYHIQVAQGDRLPDLLFPAFVKPGFESRSVGINDNSVVHSKGELARQVAYIHDTFDQPALVEEYLPGDEYTVLMLGNGRFQEFLAGKVEVDPKMFGRYPILRSDLRGVGVTKIRPAGELTQPANELCARAMEALNCLDHVRADMRQDSSGNLKIIEVNGIPGLKPIKSWSPQMFTMHHGAEQGQMEDYRCLIKHIVDSAMERYHINSPEPMK